MRTVFSDRVLNDKNSGTTPKPAKTYDFPIEHSSDMSMGVVPVISDTLYNTPVQGTAADITKKALALLPQRLADMGAQIIGTVHDEIILEIPDRLAGEFTVILKKIMIQAGKAYLSKVPVRSAVKTKERGHTENAGINRHRVGDERAPHKRRSCSIMAPSHVRITARLYVK